MTNKKKITVIIKLIQQILAQLHIRLLNLVILFFVTFSLMRRRKINKNKRLCLAKYKIGKGKPKQVMKVFRT